MTPGRTSERVFDADPPGCLVANPASCTSIRVLGPLPPKAEVTGSNPVGRATAEQKRELWAQVRQALPLRTSPKQILSR